MTKLVKLTIACPYLCRQWGLMFISFALPPVRLPSSGQVRGMAAQCPNGASQRTAEVAGLTCKQPLEFPASTNGTEQ